MRYILQKKYPYHALLFDQLNKIPCGKFSSTKQKSAWFCSYTDWYLFWNYFKFTGYNQSVTGCCSQRRQCSRYSTKTHVNSMILTSNWIWLRWETYIFKVVFVEHIVHFMYVYVSQRSQIQFKDLNHAIYMCFRWVTTTCLRWEPQPVTLWLYPVKLGNLYHYEVRIALSGLNMQIKYHLVEIKTTNLVLS